ncbi:MAG: hypothetical protein N2554_05900 [Fimbriimonadales bacterium]|nr:hypothetical protein [Fimbriimonadales bacterium]
MALTREDLQQLPQLLQGDLELQIELAQLILDEIVIARLMQRNPQLRETIRRIVLTEDLMKLPHEFREFRAETTERLTRGETEFQQFREEMVGRLTRVEKGLLRLENWQNGEIARRAGEEYERKIVLRARRIFGSGDGGSPERSERVHQQLDRWLEAAGLLDDLDEEADPINADLIWWKGKQVAVAEISIKVDKDDVRRAKQRAETLRKAGLDAMPVVIGAEWAHPETERLAEQEGVAWRIGNKLSESLVAYRRTEAPA